MKVAIVSESPADEAAIRILAQAVLDIPIVPFIPSIRTRGWTNVYKLLPAIIRQLYYQSDTAGLIVVVDSDETPIHAEHAQRLDKFRYHLATILPTLNPNAGRPPLKTALGLAIPAMEAWYLCCTDPSSSEKNWTSYADRTGDPQQLCKYKRHLKPLVYGSSRISLHEQTRIATERALELAKNIARLESLFPLGFGSLAHDLRKWLGKPTE